MKYQLNLQENNEKESYLNKQKTGMSSTDQNMFTFIQNITAKTLEKKIYCK